MLGSNWRQEAAYTKDGRQNGKQTLDGCSLNEIDKYTVILV